MKACDECGTEFTPDRSTQRFCKTACRAKANARPDRAGTSAAAPAESDGKLAAAVEAELEKLGMLDSVDGATALTLAARIESPRETGAAAASMVRELASCMDRVRAAAAPKQRDGFDNLLGSALGKLRVVS